MKLSKGKLPKIIGQKSQTMKKKKHRGGSQNNKTFRKKHKPLNLHRSSVKKIHVGGVTYDVIDDSEGGASKSKDKKKHKKHHKHGKHKDGTKKHHKKHHKHGKHKDGTKKHHKHKKHHKT